MKVRWNVKQMVVCTFIVCVLTIGFVVTLSAHSDETDFNTITLFGTGRMVDVLADIPRTPAYYEWNMEPPIVFFADTTTRLTINAGETFFGASDTFPAHVVREIILPENRTLMQTIRLSRDESRISPEARGDFAWEMRDVPFVGVTYSIERCTLSATHAFTVVGSASVVLTPGIYAVVRHGGLREGFYILVVGGVDDSVLRAYNKAALVEPSASGLVVYVGPPVRAYVNEIYIPDALIFDNRTLLRVRTMAYAFGGDVSWDGYRRGVYVYVDDYTTVRFTIDSRVKVIIAYANGVQTEVERTMTAAPIIRDGNTYLPGRYVAYAFGADVEAR